MILQMADPVKELKEIRFTSEKEMQHFCEKIWSKCWDFNLSQVSFELLSFDLIVLLTIQ